MEKRITKFLGIFLALAAMMAFGKAAWSQTEVGGCQDRICCASSNPTACDSCFTRAGSDKQKACECSCKYLNNSELQLSYKECVQDACDAPTTGGGSKISQGSVFGGKVFPNQWGAYGAAVQFMVDHDLEDNVQVVMRDFSAITKNPDSWFYHFLGLEAQIPDLTGFPGTGSGNTVVYASYTYCTAGINQDGNNIATDGCQRGSGCRELPPGLVPALCSFTTTCCRLSGGCPEGAGDGIADGRYGTTTTVCP